MLIENPITNPMHNDLMYLLLDNASRNPIRVQNVAQLAAANRLLIDGYLDEDPQTGRFVATERGKVLMDGLRKPDRDVRLDDIQPPKRGRKSNYTNAEKRLLRAKRDAREWEALAEARRRENAMLLNEIRQLREYAGTEAHVAALHVALQERDAMIAGLRQTIERLRHERR